MTESVGRLAAWLAHEVGEDVRIDGLDSVEFGHSAEMLALTMMTGSIKVTAGTGRDLVVTTSESAAARRRSGRDPPA